MATHILFANISYLLNGKPQGKFRYVLDTGDAFEKYNFEPVTMDGKEWCFGFYEAGFTKGGYEKGRQRQTRIERINPTYSDSSYIPGVTLVWCAWIPEIERTAVIGWYENAIVYRNYVGIPYGQMPGRDNSEHGYLYNVRAEKEHCVQLPYSEIIKPKWIAPRKRTYKYGFGQSNMWYAKEPEAFEYVHNILKQIENLK